MINITSGQIVFNSTGTELDRCVRAALQDAATGLKSLYGQETIDLTTITAKTSLRLVFAKYALLVTLPKRDALLAEQYVCEAFEVASGRRNDVTEASFYALTLAGPDGPYRYRKSYGPSFKFGICLFLVSLHSSGAITLPFSFNWPYSTDPNDGRVEISAFVGSELIRLVRSAGDDQSPHAAAFETITTHAKRRSWFVSAGTKTLLALGWNRPQDATLDELLKFRAANEATDFSRHGSSLPFRPLVDVLERRYGNQVAVSVAAWDRALTSTEHRSGKTNRLLTAYEHRDEVFSAFDMQPSDAFPDRLEQISKLPGRAEGFASICTEWLALQGMYLKKLRRESLKDPMRAIGCWNIYLFFYLPYWFDQNQGTDLVFPTTPSKLLSGIFVSGLVKPVFATPLTYVEFLEAYGEKYKWSPMSRYIILKQLEQFFNFLATRASELPGCQGFVQPLSKYDFPPVTRSGGTNKRPIPRRLFTFYVAYVETLVSYFEVVLDRVVAGAISGDDLRVFGEKRYVVDTLATATLTGFVPMVFLRDQAHILQFVPNCADLGRFPLKDGRTLLIPQPHGLHHVLVAVYTGLRNQHIQWLDARTFDSKVSAEDLEMTKLLVNTDKVKTRSWTPHVNKRVIEVLQLQLRWRNLIDFPSWDQEIQYERNPKTKWPAIRPLFAVEDDGYPHPDSRYAETWSKLLMAVQGMTQKVNCDDLPPLYQLLPSDVPYDAPDRSALLNRYADSKAHAIALQPKGDITPHSARVGVVSNHLTFLPAEIIGKYITGQHPAVVYHYMYVDPEEMQSAQAAQAAALQVRAYGREFDRLVADPPQQNGQFVKADGVNSNFSRSVKKDLDETLASYGCITLSLREEGRDGIDVLRETRGANAAYNKTELCPFGNHCPPEVLRDLRGMHRCGMCAYAVRSVDHLPATQARLKQTTEQLGALEDRLNADDVTRSLSPTETEQLEAERQRLGEEAAAWHVVCEMLEVQRRRIELGQDERRWVVAKPEIIEQALQRVAVPSSDTAYVLARLAESVAYPTYDSPEIHARYDLLRRKLLANLGDTRAAISSKQPPDIAFQCVGLLRSLVQAHKLDYSQVMDILAQDSKVTSLPSLGPRPLLEGQ